MRALAEALATPGPVLIDAVVDPYEPPMPPEATAEQAFEFAKALMRGEPDGGRIVKTVLKNMVKEMV